ncbi:DUF5695 domain-containing protein [Pedobacter sp. Du54]|uniref:DUF5695 domain-containing protein n=1 Tax=Pedobacter anseongensis TaxID=3133439 RepID=UPI003095C150
MKKSTLFLLLLFCTTAFAQSPWDNLAKRPSTLGIDKGTISLQSTAFSIQLLKSSQTLKSLCPKTDRSFDFSPIQFLQKRSSDGFYHLGDITLRIRLQGENEWKKYSTASKRAPITELPTGGKILAAANLANTLPADIPLTIKRYWELDNGNLALRFELINTSNVNVEIGSLGIPLIFNNILDGQSLDSAHKHNVFYDPYIGMDAGYLQVTRLSGKGPALLVVPLGKTPFEGYSPLLDDPSPRSITFEGFYEWMPLTKAHAESDWKNAQPWNKPNTIIFKAGEKRSFGLKFILAPNVKGIEQELAAQKRPVAVGIPGYVIPQDVDAKLFLNYSKAVQSITVYPEHALSLKALQALKNGTKVYQVKGNVWGRARLTVVYADGLLQTIQYKIIKPESKLLSDFGHFLTTKQWFDDANDPFHRAPSVISYDYDTKTQVTQDRRAWIAGLGDEGGSGSWLGAMMKQLIQPDKAEVQKMEQFAVETMWGKLQSNAADSSKYGVRKSLFYYEPKEMPEGTYNATINFKTWSAWPKKEANSLGRSYNYPHVAAAHWVLYRLARYHTNLVTQKDWKWYLENAFQTTMAMVNKAPYYAQFGQMEGSVFLYILKDLKAEGLVQMATELEKTMKKRADHWRSLNYPFGSEMPWDSTGQEEVYLWSAYFGYQDKADVTLNAILGYMPTVPHWGYNGSARRYWDFLYGGKLSRIERQLHHYGSGLNAIPVLTAYRHSPADLYLLRVGYGGLMGAISNITEDGFGPAAFHSFPSTLQIDGLSGDYGPNFYGYTVNSATYIVNDKAYGWLAFGGNLMQKTNLVEVKITTAAKSKVFIAPLGLWLTLDAGTFNSVAYDSLKQTVEITLNADDAFTPNAYLHIDQNDMSKGKFKTKASFKLEREAFVIPLGKEAIKVLLTK